MDIETITKLIDAGYTKAEIEQISAGGSGEPEQAGEEKIKAGEPEKPNEQSTGDTSHESEINATIKTLTDTVAGLSATVKAMQDANVKGAKTETVKSDPIKAAMDSFIETL